MKHSNAAAVADIFYRASLRKLGHHDIHDLPGRLQRLTGDINKANPLFTDVHDFAAVHVFDGDSGLGELCCCHALNSAIARAGKFGIGMSSVRHSNHFLAAYPFVQMGVEAGFITIIYSNTDPSMVGPDCPEAVIGNNPVGFGAPMPNQDSTNGRGTGGMLLDTSLAYSSIGNLLSLQREGGSIPDYWALNSDCEPTTDPAEAVEGWRVKPIGGHKGFGMALMHEILTGVFSGGETSTDIQIPGGMNTHSQTIVAISPPPHFSLETLQKQMQAFGLRLPGTFSTARSLEAAVEGIEIRSEVYTQLAEWSDRLEVEVPRPENQPAAYK
ncbi:hypothetical protein JCM12856_04340 [Spirochaeta dissipatitropha]